MNITNIITILILGLTPLCFYLWKEKKQYTKKESYQIASITTFLALLIAILVAQYANTPLTIPDFLIGTLLNWILTKSLIDQTIEIKKFVKSTATLLLFFCSSIFQYIPITIFHITSQTITPQISIYLTCFSDTCTAIILILMYYNDLKLGIQKAKKDFNHFFDVSFRIWMIGFLGMMFSNLLIHFLFPSAVAGNENSVQSMIDVSPWIMLFTAGVLAPIIEEITFRKAFQNIIKNPTIFILISGIFFGSLHVIFSYESILDFLYIIPYSSLGISFAYMVHKTDNITSSILMHFLHNTAIIGVSIVTGMIIL